MRDIVSSESNLELCPNGRNDAPMMVGVAKSFKLPTSNFHEDIEEGEEQVGDNQVWIQAPRGEPIKKKCFSTPPSQTNSNEGMQPSFSVDGEEPPL
jgi:hypothetical protein